MQNGLCRIRVIAGTIPYPEYILEAARAKIRELSFRMEFIDLYHKEIDAKKVHISNQAIAAAIDLKDLLDILYKEFKGLDIEEGYISLYTKKQGVDNLLKLVMGFKDFKQVDVNTNPYVFDAKELFPNNFKKDDARKDYYIGHLYYHNHPSDLE